MLRRPVVVFAIAAAFAAHAEGPLLHPFAGDGSTPAPPWHVVGLPQQTKPFTQFSVVDLDGKRALRVEAIESYGNLVHPLQFTGSTAHLGWQWRVEHLNEAADLHLKSGDDTTLKVCVFFDLPLDNIPAFADRQMLRFARSKSIDPVPGATVCYVWDAHLPAGTMLDNAFTRRVRYVVVRSGAERLNQWVAEKRDVAADFAKLFGAESDHMPAIIGIAVGADSDNTHTRSLGFVSGVVLEP
ncbi:MAG: DUF3047 domain-containing protein [Caldimonas sp.]